MEKLLHYIWQHRLWNYADMSTNDGRRVRVIDVGTHNLDAGPDFFNAKVEIDGQMWVGNIEIHLRASDWKRHHHDSDPAYDNVILHVVEKDDAPVYRTNGERIPQIEMRVPARFGEEYDALVNSRQEISCLSRIKEVPQLTITEWIERLAFERLLGKVERIGELLKQLSGNWEEACYITLARTLGFGINSDALERLARRTPLRLVGKHSDSLLQIEALLFGQAGLLDPGQHTADTYYQQLCREYAFLANKFSLQPMEPQAWKLFRIRPQNFPLRRIAMLAHYLHNGFKLMTDIIDAPNEKALRALFQVNLTGYWASHVNFGKPLAQPLEALSNRSIDIALINTVAPLLYARGELTDDYRMTEKAVALLEELKPENNSIVANFVFAGIPCDDALTSQALIQLKRAYCDSRKCIYCKIGHWLLSQTIHQNNN